jgi:ribulose-5-phosphate 4-epimerase/fuculose-1-phosphate aldolase
MSVTAMFEPTPTQLLPELSPQAEVALLARALWREGFDDHISGHISYKQTDGTLLVNPYHLRWDELRASQVARIDADGTQLDGDWAGSPALELHLQLHRARPDIVVAVHNHPRWASVWAAARRLPPVYDQTGSLLGGDVILHDEYGKPVGDADEARSVADGFGHATAALLAHHGALVVAPDVARAFVRCMSLEWRCRIAAQVETLNAGDAGMPMPSGPTQRLGDAISRAGYPGLWEAMARREVQRDPRVLT